MAAPYRVCIRSRSCRIASVRRWRGLFTPAGTPTLFRNRVRISAPRCADFAPLLCKTPKPRHTCTL